MPKDSHPQRTALMGKIHTILLLPPMHTGSLLRSLVTAGLLLAISLGNLVSATPPQVPLITDPSQYQRPVLSAKIDIFINHILKDWNSPGGVAVAVVRKNEQGGWSVETRGYGLAKVNGTKITANTLFEIASNSKVIMKFIPLQLALLVRAKREATLNLENDLGSRS